MFVFNPLKSGGETKSAFPFSMEKEKHAVKEIRSIHVIKKIEIQINEFRLLSTLIPC